MQSGKLPSELLARLLAKVKRGDPRVVLGPGIGRDAAVIDHGGPKLLVAKADPITFATDLIGWYAVHVNANDIACTGARPAWFLATILLPEGAPPDLAESVFGQVVEACEALQVELVGGHTEITYRLDRPLIAGAMLGELDRERLVRPEGGRPGDRLILTKGVAIEGTSVLAREAAGRLLDLGVSPAVIDEGREYIRRPGISVVAEAMAACDAVPVHAMHDPTEGGLATALHEMAAACGTGIEVRAGDIEKLPVTRAICEAAGLDPMGLLASGSLLLAVAPEDASRVIGAITEAGCAAREIGSLCLPEREVVIWDKARREPVPVLARDEVARFLSGADA